MLTNGERETLQFIQNYVDTNGFSPSWREISSGVYVRSPAAIQRRLIGLCSKGYITLHPRIPRSIVLNVEL